MIVNEISALAEKAADRYLNVIFGFRGAYSKAISQQDPTTAKVLSEFSANLYDIARTYLNSEEDVINSVTAEIALLSASDALSAVGATESANDIVDALSAYLNAFKDYIRSEIAVQLERDIAAVRKKLRSIGLQAEILSGSTGISRKAAIIQLKLTDSGEFRFYFTDRQNRKWPSQKYVRTIWRQHLLSVYNEVYLYVLSKYGRKTAMVKHMDANSKSHMVTFNIVEYEAIKDEYFHPNANAVVSAVEE